MVHFGAHLAQSRLDGLEERYVNFDALRELAICSTTSCDDFYERWKAELDKCLDTFQTLSLEAFRTLVELCPSNALACYLRDELPGLNKSFNRGYATIEIFGSSAASLPERQHMRRFLRFLREHYGEESNRKEATIEVNDVENWLTEIQNNAQPLFSRRQTFCMLNLEALRKLATKIGKYVDLKLSRQLLGEIGMSPMALSLAYDFGSRIAALSRLLSDDSCALSLKHQDSCRINGDDLNSKYDSGRESEDQSWDCCGKSATKEIFQLESLIEVFQKVPKSVRNCLVSHRGFHCKQDSLDRPLENTVAAYEHAWAAGMKYCECDITITLDHNLVLCHDSHLYRLAHNQTAGDSKATRPISELTFDELRNFPLKNGSHTPQLTDVLQCAQRTGPDAQLVVELKAGADGAQVAASLCFMLCNDQSLLSRVAVVMSFDLFIVHNFCRFFDSTFEACVASRGCKEIGSADAVRPKILFLTKNPSDDLEDTEVSIDWSSGTKDELIKQIEYYLNQGNTHLDGIYSQYHPDMLNADSVCSQVISELVKTRSVGVWNDKNDPDRLDIANRLVRLGCSFVNTDLPRNFLSKGTSRRR